MAGGEGIYCRSAIQRLARDPLPAAGTSGEHVTGTRATTPPHGARGVPSLPTYARIRVHYLIACKPLVQTATPAATGDRLQDRVPRILTDILTTHPPTPGTLGVTAHEWPATGFLQTTDRNPGIGGLRLQTDWDPNLAPRPRFWSDLPIGAEPGFNTGSGTPLCDFGTAEVGRWWFILHFNILYFSIPSSPRDH